jgi:hypothetical protein
MHRIIFLLALAFFNCLSSIEPISLGDCAIKPYSKLLAKQKGWHLIATGMNNRKNRVSLNFKGSQQLILAQAREVFIDETQRFLKHLKLHGSCPPTSVSIDRLEFGISFGPQGRSHYHAPYIALVFCLGDWVIYEKYDPELGYLVTTHEESYEEALAIVRGDADGPLACQ